MDNSIEPEELRSIKATFDKAIEDLLPKIKDRYLQLSNQLEECEKEFDRLGIKP